MWKNHEEFCGKRTYVEKKLIFVYEIYFLATWLDKKKE
jgi:hypothetical protein